MYDQSTGHLQSQEPAAASTEELAREALAMMEPEHAVPSGPSEMDDPLGELKNRFDQHYRTVVSTDLALLSLHTRRTGEYWDLGEAATDLKAQVAHGEWLPYLHEHGYVERTIQRAMRIYKLFRSKKEDCLGLTVEEAENFGKTAEEADDNAAMKAASARTKGIDRIRKKLLAEALKRAEDRRTEARELAQKAGVAIPLVRLHEMDESPLDDVETGTSQDDAQSDGTEDGQELPDEDDGQEPSDEDDGQELADEDEAKIKSEALWAFVGEVAADDFDITDAERDAFATFVSAVGGENRAIRVSLYHAWNHI